MLAGLSLSLEQWQQMFQYIQTCLPEEACGLIGGKKTQADLILPVENEAHSPVRFRMKPEQQLAAFLTFEQNGLDLIGIYHSHPTGPDFPSETDLSEFAYPGTAYLIWSFTNTEWKLHGYQLDGGRFIEIPVNVHLRNSL
ncbi:MAG: M67 family metallopeptidase [Anaerolineaceae bacterium]|nr:M67 family metallopeptidase [Anaerolineaceae bacterium]